MILGRRKYLKALSSLALLSGAKLTLAQSNLNRIGGSDLTAKQQQFNFPGGVVDLTWPKTSSELPTVKFGLSEPILFDLGTSWRCLVGLTLDTLPGEYVVYVKESDSELPAFTLRFSVEQKLYPVLTGETNQFGLSQQIPKFSELDFVNSVPPELPLQEPVDTEWVDSFGRVFVNESEDRENSIFVGQNCLTLNSSNLSSAGVLVVVAPQNGIVCNLYSSPNRLTGDDESMMIIIDHGRGLFSCLDGVRDLTVKMGNGIVRGAVLGKVQREDREDSPEPIEANEQSSNSTPFSLTASTLSANTLSAKKVASEKILFRWYCVLNNAYVNPLILTKLS